MFEEQDDSRRPLAAVPERGDRVLAHEPDFADPRQVRVDLCPDTPTRQVRIPRHSVHCSAALARQISLPG